MKLYFVDSNVLIFSETDAPEHAIAQKKLIELQKEGKLVINTIIISETFHKLSIILDKEEAEKRIRFILNSESVLYLPIEIETIRAAINSAVINKIRINDAIIAQHSIDSKTDGILTDNIKDFKKIPKIKLIPLR